MALTADRITQMKIPGDQSYPMAVAKCYAGGLVAVNSSGYAAPAADTAGMTVVGGAKKTVDNSGGSAGDLKINVESGIFRFKATSITQAMIGQAMYVVDDETFDDQPGTNGIFAGVLVEYVSATEGWILVGPHAMAILTDVTATAAELNVLDGVVAGTVTASKGVVAGASKDLDTLLIGDQQIKATMVVGAEAANVINVAIQLKDGKNADLAVRGSALAYLSDDANGDSIAATAPSGGVAIGTDGLAIALVANKCWLLTSEVDGDIDLNITDTGTPTFYLVLILENGRRVISDAITFA